MRRKTALKLWKKLFGYSIGDKVRVHVPRFTNFDQRIGIICYIYPPHHELRYLVTFIDTNENLPLSGEDLEYVGGQDERSGS